MPHDEWAECPNCGKTAWGRNEIEAEFGYRFGGTTPQSWCRYCRARERNEKTADIRNVLGTVNPIAVQDMIAPAMMIKNALCQ